MPRSPEPSRPSRRLARPGRPVATSRPEASLGDLGIAGIRSRHIAVVFVVLLVGWVLVIFAGQVSAAAQAAGHAAELRAGNEALRARVEALQREQQIVTSPAWVQQQARAYQLGGAEERAFRLAPGAPSLAPDAPGSATVRLGAKQERELSPLDAWLEVLFGPAPGG